MRFRPDIEGLRAVAILLVVGYHARVPGFSGGFIGVDVFFVLSGYLITGLLLAEVDRTGRVDLARFYARRARRLLPAASIVLLVTLVFGRLILSPLELRRLASAATATAGYFSNLHFIGRAINYQAGGSQDHPLLHTWSLAVEEQFYLVWPLLVVGAMALARRFPRAIPVSISLGVAAIASFAASRYLTSAVQPWAFFGSPARAWEFAVGGLAVLVPERLAGHRVARAGALAGLALLVVGTVRFGEETPFPGLAALVPVLGTAAILVPTGHPDFPLARLLSLRGFQRLGQVSYSWYLWHWPVLVYAGSLGAAATLLQRVGWAMVALGLAAATFRLVEDPIRRNQRLQARPRTTLALAGALTVVGLAASLGLERSANRFMSSPVHRAFALAATEEPAPPGCQRQYLEVDGPVCAFGDTTSAATVVLFGDSHATQWLPAVEKVAEARGWRVELVTKADCPAASLDLYSPPLQRRYTECLEWRAAEFDRIARLRPRLLIVANSSGYPRRSSGPNRISPNQWGEGLRRTFLTLAPTAGQVLFLRDSPRPGFRVPECLSRARFAPLRRAESCAAAREVAVDSGIDSVERAAATGISGVERLDLTDAICGPIRCEPMLDGIVVYKDSNHLTAAFAARLADPLGRAIGAVTADRRWPGQGHGAPVLGRVTPIGGP